VDGESGELVEEGEVTGRRGEEAMYTVPQQCWFRSRKVI